MNAPDRYHRQTLLDGIGARGQRRLSASGALIVGCGALGAAAAESLCRAGVGRLVLVDRDIVELTNLQRQALFEETDAFAGVPKAAAVRDRLARINSRVRLDAAVTDFNPANAEWLADGCDIILDGTDNFETRFLLNDLAVKRAMPYIYGGAVATRGMVYAMLPHTPGGDSVWERAGAAGPCLRCILDEAPAAGVGETCDTVGVLGPAAHLVAAYQAAEAIKLLTDNLQAVNRRLLSFDPWRNEHRQVDIAAAHQPGRCPCCAQRRFDYLEGDLGSSATTLCGRNAVQVRAPRAANGDGQAELDLAPIADRLRDHGPVIRNQFLLRARLTVGSHAPEYQLTLFPDGRAIIHGTADPALARSLYARYVGL